MKYSLLALFLLIAFSCSKPPQNTKLSGPVFGTSYSVIYEGTENYQKDFNRLFNEVNESMSTYIEDSKISRINRGEDVELDNHFKTVFEASKLIYRYTEGAFDPTIGGVVNAWDFGPEGAIQNIDSTQVDSLMKSVGFNRMGIVDNHVKKTAPNAFIDFNAIAKGYGVDVIGEFLESKQVNNYLVEIGGEIRCRGYNAQKESLWKVGVEMPHFDGSQSVMRTIDLENAAMATSGTYRKFKVDSLGNRYSHIIDTKTGYPSKTNLLSISVIAENCMTADAYATAFKSMGMDRIEEFLVSHPELQVFLIFENENGELETKSLNGFPE